MILCRMVSAKLWYVENFPEDFNYPLWPLPSQVKANLDTKLIYVNMMISFNKIGHSSRSSSIQRSRRAADQRKKKKKKRRRQKKKVKKKKKIKG